MLPRACVSLCDRVSNKPDTLIEKWTVLGLNVAWTKILAGK